MRDKNCNFNFIESFKKINCSLREVECFLDKANKLVISGKIGILLKNLFR